MGENTKEIFGKWQESLNGTLRKEAALLMVAGMQKTDKSELQE